MDTATSRSMTALVSQRRMQRRITALVRQRCMRRRITALAGRRCMRRADNGVGKATAYTKADNDVGRATAYTKADNDVGRATVYAKTDNGVGRATAPPSRHPQSTLHPQTSSFCAQSQNPSPPANAPPRKFSVFCTPPDMSASSALNHGYCGFAQDDGVGKATVSHHPAENPPQQIA